MYACVVRCALHIACMYNVVIPACQLYNHICARVVRCALHVARFARCMRASKKETQLHSALKTNIQNPRRELGHCAASPSAANNREDMRSERTKFISTKAPLCDGMEVDTRQNLQQKRRPPSAALRLQLRASNHTLHSLHSEHVMHTLHSESYHNSDDLPSLGLMSIWMAYWSMVASTICCNGLLSARPLLTKARLALWRSPLGR